MIPVLLASLVLASAAPAAPEHARGAQGFEAETSRIDRDLRKRITGSSWHRGCPVARKDLRHIRATYVGFDGRTRPGSIIVHEDEANETVRVLRSLYRHDFPIRRMQLIDRYDGDDHRSMNADNTSGFNCRFVAGTNRWSEHAYGRAIDLNPIENPYVTPSGSVSPPAGQAYTDRSNKRKGMVHRGDGAYRAFKRQGWKWGGNWSGTKDYQHFSTSGR